MPVAEWLSKFGQSVAAGDLQSSAATSLVSFVNRHAPHIASFIEARRGETGELVVLDFKTGKPQHSVHLIKRVERVGIWFNQDNGMPLTYMLRDDFPDTEHQALTFEGNPRIICIDDRSWEEARLTWTPVELIHRILSWFSRAGRGELHDARQPLEPLIFGVPFARIFIQRDFFYETHKFSPVEIQGCGEQIMFVYLAAYRIAPEKMKRLEFAPNNLGGLANMLAFRGVDLFDDLTSHFSRLMSQEAVPDRYVHMPFGVILEMPIMAPDDAKQDGVDLRAFIADRSIGDIAVDLGAALPAEADQGSEVGFVLPLTPQKANINTLRSVIVHSAEVHYMFDRELATQMSGRQQQDSRKVVMVGAGAIGSHVADCLVREGRFCWTIIDHDCILPHNLARHIARNGDVSRNKANLVAETLSATLQDAVKVATGIPANVMTAGSNRTNIDEALEQADLIIDATTSIVAERYLSDHFSEARRVSIFLNPTGSAAVFLAEPADRSLTLRDLEAQYLGFITKNYELSEHLAPSDGTYTYTGACRAITNLIPQSRIMVLGGLLASALGKLVDQHNAKISIWSMGDSGSVKVREATVEAVSSFRMEQWIVTVDQGLVDRIRKIRISRLPEETGGVLTGIVDIPARRIHLIDAAPAPPDSKSSTTGFERGTSGVQQYLERAQEQTLGQIRYVGEWHSHPLCATTSPSSTDLSQIDWLATLLDIDTLPALMLIVGDHEINITLAGQKAELSGTDSVTAIMHYRDDPS